jgi:N-acetylglucosamine-6-phosphate deacetylase
MGGVDRKVTEIEGYHYKTEEPVTISVQDGIITNIEKRQLPEDKADLAWIGPGLVDLQINGYNGWDFNTFPVEKESVMQLTRAVWREGVTSYYPTVITNGDEQIEQALRCIASACAEDSVSNGGVAGIHLEGPFISPEDGPRGAHSKSFTKAPDWSLLLPYRLNGPGPRNLLKNAYGSESPSLSAILQQQLNK